MDEIDMEMPKIEFVPAQMKFMQHGQVRRQVRFQRKPIKSNGLIAYRRPDLSKVVRRFRWHAGDDPWDLARLAYAPQTASSASRASLPSLNARACRLNVLGEAGHWISSPAASAFAAGT
jgi:hypothetical protein